MFLTRMAINGARRSAWKLLQSPQAMHAAVLSGFPLDDSVVSDDGRVLWRLDRSPHSLWLYVVSPSQPDLTHLVEQAGWPARASWQTRDYEPFLARLGLEQRWVFRLAANPVHTINTMGGAKKRYGHVTVTQQESWLLTRVERLGFRVADTPSGPDVAVSRRERHEFRRGGGRVTLDTAQYDGVLEVTDPATLRTALTRGIGHAKGYGCGLLTLAPVPIATRTDV
jgi:CRISPR system Cascade subunit CasE